MTRVLHCLEDVNTGGVEQRRLIMARRLPSRFECRMICTYASEAFRKQFAEAGWEVHAIGRPRSILDLGWYRRAIDIAVAFQPEIIHGAVYEGVALANVLGWRLPKARVISEETSDPVNRRWTGHLLLRALIQRSDRIIGVSSAVERYLKDTLLAPAARTLCIPNGVEMPEPENRAKTRELKVQLGLAAGDYIIGCVGRLTDRYKRFSDVIEAARLLKMQGSDVTVLIVGDGPDEDALKSLAHYLGVADRVVFTGHRPDIRTLYYLMDVFVLPSANEAFGLVVVEAMLAKRPIIASKVGGVPDILDYGRCGHLIEPRRPEEIAAAIARMKDDAAMAEEFAKRAFARARERYTAERYIEDIVRLYGDLAPEPGGRT